MDIKVKISPNHSSRRGAIVDVIVIHHTASSTLAGTVDWLLKGEAQASYHFLIGKDGQVVQMVDEGMKAWHAGMESHLHGLKTSVNARSIGIGLVNDGSEEFTGPQINVLVRLLNRLVQRHRIKMHNILGHRDICLPVGRKMDPHDLFPWHDVLLAVSMAIPSGG